jgi:2-hydroxyacyl-CoA lyase 1
MDGPTFIAKTLKQQGIEIIFGIVGVPITPIAEAAQKEGIKFYGFRNEQSAGYAASVAGYLTKKPACCITVSGPGMLHALPGLLNATSNCWPMLLLSSAPDSRKLQQGAFQEAPQLNVAAAYAKYSARVESLVRLPMLLEQAMRSSVYGRPGGVYIEIPGDVINSKINENEILHRPAVGDVEPISAHPKYVEEALRLLSDAKRPLLIFGKGAAYSRAGDELLKFVETTKIPFLASPMGKGLISDLHPLSVGAARSLALKQADVVLLVGARLNWMFDFGSSQQFSPEVRFIKVDISAENVHDNVRAAVPLVGDAREVIGQLNSSLSSRPFTVDESGQWWKDLKQKNEANKALLEKQCQDTSFPLMYHGVLSEIRKYITDDVILVNEGANTMDFGRVVFSNTQPQQRLDAGTLATMGVGVGYAIAAAIVSPNKKVIAVEGDSAFGFSGMELETICRYQLPVSVIIINNNGIYRGVDTIDQNSPIPPTVLSPNARYEKMMEAFGGKGYYASTIEEVRNVLHDALVTNKHLPSCVNIMIKPDSFTPKIVANTH